VVAREVPHSAQNLAWGRFSTPQPGQRFFRGAAHSIQNFAPSGFVEPQLAQRMLIFTPPCRVLARLRRALDLARLFELPAWHPDRMIAAQLVLYVGLGIVIAATLWSHWNAAHP